jgi:hypothetical protein
VTEIFETELGDINAADVVRRCAWKTCDKGFQGRMPTGWDRLGTHLVRWPDATRTIAEVVTDRSSERNAALCPKHAAELEALLAARLSDPT